MATQNFQNHAKFDPPFHFFLAPVSLAILIATIVNVVKSPSLDSGFCVLVGLWALILTFKTRIYSMKVQDRLIRLEETVRLKEILPEAMKGRIKNLTIDQMIGLRFASDNEVAGLVEKTLANNWNRKQIKQAVQNWRADDWRV